VEGVAEEFRGDTDVLRCQKVEGSFIFFMKKSEKDSRI
jgi:hypothetical protein